MIMMMMMMKQQLPAITMTLVCIAGIHRKRKEGFVGVKMEEVPFVCECPWMPVFPSNPTPARGYNDIY